MDFLLLWSAPVFPDQGSTNCTGAGLTSPLCKGSNSHFLGRSPLGHGSTLHKINCVIDLE